MAAAGSWERPDPNLRGDDAAHPTWAHSFSPEERKQLLDDDREAQLGVSIILLTAIILSFCGMVFTVWWTG